MTPGLGDHTAFKGDLRGIGVIGVIGVDLGVTEHEIRLHGSDHINQLVFVVAGQFQRVVAEIKKLDVVHIQGGGRSLGLDPPLGFYPLQGHAVLLPQLCTFAPFAVRKTDHGDVIALFLVQGDGPAAAPDEISGMGRNNQGRFLISHRITSF